MMAKWTRLLFVASTLLSSLCTAQRCRNPYPGLARMSRGVDLTSLDLFPANLAASNGFGRTLFTFTCASANRWSHPENPENSFEVPDQIAGLNSLPAGALLVRTDFEQSLKQFKNWLAVSVGLDITAGGLFGAFSASGSYKDSQEQIMRLNKSLAQTSATVTTTQIDFQFADQMLLSEDFLDYINRRLPDRYETDPKLYQAFVDAFGTHYFESAQFGGLLYQKTLIDNEYLSNTDQTEVSVHVEANFKQKVGLRGDLAKGRRDIEESMRTKSRTYFYYYGGKSDLSNEKEFLRQWQPTVYKDPWLLSGKLKPIEGLIKRENIRVQVGKAIKVKRAKAYLADLKNAISLGQTRLSAKDREEIDAIERVLGNRNSSETALEKAGSDSIDGLFERVQVIRAQSQLASAYEKAFYIRDLRNCLMTATANCDRGLYLALTRKAEAWASIQQRLYQALYYNEQNDKLSSEQMFHLVGEAGRFYYSIEYMELAVPKGNYRCVRNMVDRNSECQRTHQERGHKFSINSV